jgi:hypothetical protein
VLRIFGMAIGSDGIGNVMNRFMSNAIQAPLPVDAGTVIAPVIGKPVFGSNTGGGE